MGGNNDEINEDEYDPTQEVESRVKTGHIWQLGKHRLMCGDATIKKDTNILMKSELADMTVTDPPYNVNYEGATKDKLTIKNDNKTNDDFRLFLTKAMKNMKDCLKDGGVFYIFHADSEGYNFRGACHDNELKIRQCLIWNKSSMVMGRQDYHWKHEPILYGWKDGASHLWNNDRKQTTVLDFEKPHANLDHPTMKPLTILSYLIQNNSNENDIVVDLFGGSGSTLLACEQTNRKCFMMELDPVYCDVIIKRWETFTNEKAYKLN